jgi:hypothetical protein
MLSLSKVIVWTVYLFLGSLFATVAVQFLVGQINARGLLSGRVRGGASYFSPERVQLLIITLGLALQYLAQVLENTTPGQLPPVPQSWVALLGGSHAVYLAGKAYAMLLHKPKRTSA